MGQRDFGGAYDGVRMRVLEIAAEHGGRLDEPVPACPAWTVRQLIGHLVGVAEDLCDGNVDNYASDQWTARQVSRLGSSSLDDLAALWAKAAACLGGLVPAGDAPPVALAFGDAVVHEADLRAVLAPRSRVPDDAVRIALASGVARWRQVLAEASVPPLQIAVRGVRDWWLGDREAAGAVVLDAPAYEVFRALHGRRSRAQVASFAWLGDSTPYLDAGLPYPFRWSDHPVED